MKKLRIGRWSGGTVDPGEAGHRQAREANGLLASLTAMFAHFYVVVVTNDWVAATTEDVATELGRAPTSFERLARDHAAAWGAASGGA